MAVENNDHIDYIFETSWEVCNKVGGIYTVLSTKAKTLVETYQNNVLFIGPDLWNENNESPWFIEDSKIYSEWIEFAAKKENLKIRTGRWDIPGSPNVVLIDFNQFFQQRNEIFYEMWDRFKVNSLNAYGDYDESCMFAYASGKVIESFYKFHQFEGKQVIAHFNEWMLGMGLLYVKKYLPKVATVFTTHATCIGRSIAGNMKPLYNQLYAYDGDQMAKELNMEAKHSIEKTAAHEADCFTTVSDITAKESHILLHRDPVVTPNGFEKDFIPTGKEYDTKRAEARQILKQVAENLLGYPISKDIIFVGTSGRYEYRNKGIDVFVDSMARINKLEDVSNKEIIAFIMVPAWIEGARIDLKDRLASKKQPSEALPCPYLTHWIHNRQNDPILNQIAHLKINNHIEDNVKVIFIPSYLNGNDGIFNKTYYDLLIGFDITVFPSYYEPWGYTPHESIAFSVPTVTTSLAGFGLWMRRMGDKKGMDDGAEVISRDDYNFVEVSEAICNCVYEMTTKTDKQKTLLRGEALERANLADWAHFFQYYQLAYRQAFSSRDNRLS